MAAETAAMVVCLFNLLWCTAEEVAPPLLDTFLPFHGGETVTGDGLRALFLFFSLSLSLSSTRRELFCSRFFRLSGGTLYSRVDIIWDGYSKGKVNGEVDSFSFNDYFILVFIGQGVLEREDVVLKGILFFKDVKGEN